MVRLLRENRCVAHKRFAQLALPFVGQGQEIGNLRQFAAGIQGLLKQARGF